MTFVGHAVKIATAILARACVLLAFSEFAFFNEEPVTAFLAASGPVGKGVLLVELIAFYCVPASLLLALEPLMTTPARVLLAGAFVGWSIEAVLVPASYENVPLSYFWTAITWHATINVALGWVVLRGVLLKRGLAMRVASAVLLGGLVALWSTWTWDAIGLTLTGFGVVLFTTILLVVIGYALSGLSPETVRMGKVGVGISVGVNLLLFTMWATVVPLLAGGLVALAAFNGMCLMMARTAPAPGPAAGFTVLRLWPLAVALPVGLLGFAAIAGTGAHALIGEILVPLVAFGGLPVYAAAVISALRGRARVGT